jgi:cell division protein FtsN
VLDFSDSKPEVRPWHLALKITFGCAGLALLSACASSGGIGAVVLSTDYYVTHAAGNYNPPGPPSDPWGPYIRIAARRFDVPERWIREVMQAESGGQEYVSGQLTVSPAGAMGLMQLEPETYEEMAARYGLDGDPFNPYDNIMAGTAYIHEMYEVYGSPGFLAAYDAGPGRLDSYMSGNRPLPNETKNYIAMIAPEIQGYYPAHRSEADQLALNTLPAGMAPGILPTGFVPEQAPPPEAPRAPESTVQVAALVRPSLSESAVYSPAPARSEPPPSRPTFSFIPEAMADTPPPQPENQPVEVGHLGWAIQLGAYKTRNSANAAIGIAELSAVQMLMNGQPVVVSYHVGGLRKYHARVVGLPHEDAVNACERLRDGPTGCIVLSPASQS